MGDQDGQNNESEGGSGSGTSLSSSDGRSSVTEPKYEAVFKQAPDGIIVHDAEGHVLDVNEAVPERLGYTREELLSMEISDIEVGLDEELLREKWQSVDTGSMERMEVEGVHRRKDGSTFPVEVWVSRLGSEGAGRLVALARDITERKEREQELEQYEHLWQNLPIGVCRIDPTGDGEFVDVNENLVEIAGADSREELLEQSIADLWEDESERDALIERLAETGLETVERRFETLDGRTVWLRLIVMAREDDPYVDAVVQDVTDRRQREIHLMKAQEVGNIGWWRKDIPSDGIYWSEQIYEMWGAEGQSGLIDHETFMEFIHPDDREEVDQAWEAAKEGEDYDIEHRIVTDDGELRWMREKADLTFDEDGDPIHAVGVVQDITERKEREQEIERHRTYIENANDVITVIDPDGIIEYVNPAVERVLDWEREELLGENGFEYVHPGDREDRIDDIEALAEGTDEEAVLEFRFQRGDGEYCWIEATVRDLLDDPDIEGLLLSNRRITDRKEHEQQLSALHGATRQFIDADSKGEVAEIAVKTAKELLDFSLPSMWYPEDDELVLVANSEEHQKLLEEAGTPEPSHPADSWIWDVFEGEETVVRSPISRDELAADVPLQSTIVLPIGDHGIFACAAKGEVDFTDRQIRATETLAQNVRVALDQLDQRAALERQKAFTDDLLDAIEDVVYVLNPDGDFRDWNAAFEDVAGYTSEELESMNALDLFKEADTEAAAAALEESFEAGRTRVESDLLTAEGESIPYEFIANAFEDPDGEPVVAGIGRDRSRHVEYERTLEEQRDSLEILNQVVRHDIRNNMTVVRGRANLLAEHVEEAGQEDLEAVQNATESAIELTKTARDLSETMLSTDEDVEPVGLGHHLETPVENARSEFENAVITTEDRIPDVQVRGNDLLEAVFRNLIQNAIVHNDKEAPKVRISIALEAERITVEIADNGPGIPDDQKETIFGKGEKGLDSPGTGLGLYLVQTLVEQYGGDVWVEDNDPEGSVFYVELPRIDERESR